MARVTVCEEHLQNSKLELEEIIQTVLTVKQSLTDQALIELMNEIISACPLEVVGRMQPYSNKDMVSSAFKKGDYQSLVKLNAAVKNQIMETKR
jgi:hypothetical protein